MRHGVPVPLAVTFPLVFPALDQRIYELNQVEVRPKPLREGSVMEVIREYYERGEVFYMGGARLTFVVEKDGRVGDVYLPADLEDSIGRALRQAIPNFHFSPAVRRGQPVRVWIDTDLGYNITVGQPLFPTITTGNGRNNL